MLIFVKMMKTTCVEAWRSTNDPVNLIAFRQEQLCPIEVGLMGEFYWARDQRSQIGTILSSDTLKNKKLACRLFKSVDGWALTRNQSYFAFLVFLHGWEVELRERWNDNITIKRGHRGWWSRYQISQQHRQWRVHKEENVEATVNDILTSE